MLLMLKKIDVFKDKIKVGTLAITNEREIAFQYSNEWLKNGFSINPFKLPLSNRLFISTSPYFRGNFGVFADSLPDAFGELVLDRYLRTKGIGIESLSPLDRLAYVGNSSMGALEYVPHYDAETKLINDDFDELQKECNDLLDSKEVKNITNLYSLSGSSGGARPKALITYNNEEYIVKFSSRFDPKNIAELEYETMLLARSSGINVPEVKLVTNDSGNKYYLIKRFDRCGKQKLHMVSVAGLLECDFRAPCLDYNDLIKVTNVITNNNDDVIEMYRRMVFNVLINNQDDHAKNFAFLYDEINRVYRLAPAFDLTPCKTYFGEHTTSVNGKGKDINDEDMLIVAKNNHINERIAKGIIEKIKNTIKQ